MGKIILAGVVGFGSFILGVLGLYFAFPAIAPERAIKARHYVDSLMTVPGGQVIAHGAALNGAEAGHEAEADSAHTPADTLAHHTPEPKPEAKPSPELKAARDSVRVLTQQVARLSGENQTLRKQATDKKQAPPPAARPTAPARPAASAAEVAGLSATLAKLEDKELRAIVQQIDSEVLEQLYKGSSSKNQARLLEAMPADQAARFVQTIVKGKPAESKSPAQDQRPAKAAQ